MTSFYAPLEGDLIRSKYADRLIKILLECSRDFGSQLPAAICCDLNRNPSECAHLNVALARTGWTDLGQLGTGEAESPPTHYPFGAAHKGMQGLGCSRIDLLLVNTVALAAFTKYDQLYGQGVAKHSMLVAECNLPSLGAKVTMPKTHSSMVNLDRQELPGAINEELIYFANAPGQRDNYEELLEQRLFTEACDI